MEVVHDLDVEAAQLAQGLGLPLARAATPGQDPRFASMITALVGERLAGQRPGSGLPPAALSPAALGSPGCGSADCCRPPAPASRPGRPAAAS
jgi:ferrochelatase